MAKKVFAHKHGLRDPRIMHPDRDWFIGLLLAGTLFVVCAGWSAKVFFENKNVGLGQTVEKDVTDSVYREAQVAEALLLIREREVVLSRIVGNASVGVALPEVVEDKVQATSSASGAVDEDIPQLLEEKEELPQLGE